MLAIVVTIYAIFSVLASIILVAAAKLSSRISQQEQLVEVYNTVVEEPQPQPIITATYSLES